MGKVILGLLLSTTCIPVICADDVETSTYSNPHHGFSFGYPKTWTHVDKLGSGSGIFLKSPLKTEDGMPIAEISFGAVGISSKMSLDLFELGTLMPDEAAAKELTLDLKKGTETTLGGLKAHRHVYSSTAGAKERFCTCLAISSDRGFCFTLIAAPDEFKKYEPVFNRVLASFKTFAPDGKDSVFRNKMFGFGIDYPVTWNATANRPDTVIIKAPPETANEKFTDMMYLGCVTREENVSDDTVAKNALAAIKKNPNVSKIEPISEVTVGKYKAFRFAYTDAEEGLTAHSTEYIVSCEKYIIHVMCITDAVRQEASGKIFESMLKTFVIENSQNK